MLLLAKGRPILIDLAVEWLAREIPLPWLLDNDLEALKSLSDAERKKHQEEFEKNLVRRITEMRCPTDWLFRTLARIYPLDVEGIVALLDLSEEKAKPLFEEAKGYVFVKSLPDGRISLHDEVRRMVTEYVWPDIDPGGDRRRRDSKRAVGYLKGKIDDLSAKIEQLRQQEEKAQRGRDNTEAYNAFIRREALERETWVLEEQQLIHQLSVDVEQGMMCSILSLTKQLQNIGFLTVKLCLLLFNHLQRNFAFTTV